MAIPIGVLLFATSALADTKKWKCAVTETAYGTHKITKWNPIIEVDFGGSRFRYILEDGRVNPWITKKDDGAVVTGKKLY